ncbi:MAG: c-type cytochrome, partial [Terriglobia bacterium]
ALGSPSEKIQAAARGVARHLELNAFLSTARKEALDSSLPPNRREMALYSLGSGFFDDVRPVFEKLLASPLDLPLLKAVLQALSAFDRPEVSGLLVERWKSFAPSVRNEVLDVLLSHRVRVPELLKAIERGRIEPGALDLARREKLLRHPDPNISGRARQLFQEEQSDRNQVMKDYQAAVYQAGDAIKGKLLFEKNCATCHMPKRGHRVGPDLSGVSSNTKAQLLQSILDPSKTIEPRFRNYILITRNGRIHDGLMVAETPGSLTLRRADVDDETILRSNLAEIRASSVSLMPDGLEKNMNPKDMADLIAFLQGSSLH